jgi:Zn-dependent oligopeptidase
MHAELLKLQKTRIIPVLALPSVADAALVAQALVEGGLPCAEITFRTDAAIDAIKVMPEWNRFPNTFSHIFGGGYAAGYYSYKWAEVLSADAYAAFEEAPQILDARTGARFRDEVLAVGGSRPAAESFRAFRGREPSVEALLRHNGMIPA